jgi:hypothetical protein
MAKARTTVYWNDATALHTPREVATAAHTAREHGVTGFVPSLEAFSYIADRPEAGEPWVVGKRHRPFGFDPAAEGKMPYNTLPVRVQRFAYRAFSRTPELEFADFERQLGNHFFGPNSSPATTADLLALQRIWSRDSDWYWASPLLDPDFFAEHAKRLQWQADKLSTYDKDLESLREIAARYADATNPNAREMAHLAKSVVDRWDTQQTSPSRVRQVNR